MDASLAGRASLPERIGEFRILRKLGEGGMGVVFEAEQESPRRAVALKVLTSGALSAEMRRRFELEAQVLGHLQHASIAQVYAAGLFEGVGGPQPFFAMELIRGEPLGVHASKLDLGTRARLELVARICDGIQHAHQRGVIHRDLKPENILVDPDGQPKILDFGIARATNADIQTATLRTDLGQIMGTVQYMSPEQAAGDTGRIDARSDIYSLGVVAYQLVSGALPYRSDDPMVLEALRVVREEDARPVSTVNRSLRGDVETILGKALEKDVERRYASAADFAADIRRYLSDEPIRARRPSATYQLGKFARRNKALVLGLAGVFVALVIGLLGTLRGFFAAREEAARANQTSRFLRTILEGVDPSVAQGSDTTLLKAILEDTANRIGDELAGQPLAEAEIRSTMVTTYFALSAYEAALEQARAALAIWTRELGDDDPKAIEERRKVGISLGRLGRLAEAEGFLRESLARAERVLGPEGELTLNARCELGVHLMDLGRYDEAAVYLRPVLELRRRTLGPDHKLSLVALNCVAVNDLYAGRSAEASELLHESMERWGRTQGETHPETIKAAFNLAAAYSETGRLAEAEGLYREVLERNQRILGEEHESTLATMVNLGLQLRNQGRSGEAEELLRGALEIQRRLSAPDAPPVLELEAKLAGVLGSRGELAEAEALARHVHEGLLRAYGEEHRETLMSLATLATILNDGGDLGGAVELREELVPKLDRVLGEEHPDTLLVRNDLAVGYYRQRRYAEAEPLVRGVLAARRRILGDTHRSTLQSIDTLAAVSRAQGRWEEAVALEGEMVAGWSRWYGDQNRVSIEAAANMVEDLDKLEDFGNLEPALRALLAYHERTLAPDTLRIGIDLALLGGALMELDRAPEAQPVLERAEGILLQAFERSLDAPDAERSELARRIASLYEAWGRPEDAAGWRE